MDSTGVARRANIKNQQLTTASTSYYVEAVALYNTLNTTKQKKEEYKEVISLLKRGYSVRNTAKLCFHEATVARQSK